MHHEPNIPEKATHSSSASHVAMQSCCLACPSRKSNTRFGLPGFPHFFPFLDVSAITELCKSDTSSTVKAFAAPSKRINVNVVVVKKRRVPCRVINFTKGHFSRGHFSLIVHTLLRRAEMKGRCVSAGGIFRRDVLEESCELCCCCCCCSRGALTNAEFRTVIINETTPPFTFNLSKLLFSKTSKKNFSKSLHIVEIYTQNVYE